MYYGVWVVSVFAYVSDAEEEDFLWEEEDDEEELESGVLVSGLGSGSIGEVGGIFGSICCVE